MAVIPDVTVYWAEYNNENSNILQGNLTEISEMCLLVIQVLFDIIRGLFVFITNCINFLNQSCPQL